jgi:hypothetical protein
MPSVLICLVHRSINLKTYSLIGRKEMKTQLKDKNPT